MSFSNSPDSVLLIHGTGAASKEDQGDGWWQIGSSFWRSLDNLFCDRAAQFGPVAFHWTGRNSERDREHASAVLLEDMRRLESAHQPYHLVGHSHGGSVIWMALRMAVESDCELAHLRSWTSIGTPFLKFMPKPIRLWQFLPLILAAIAMVFVPMAGTHDVLVSPWTIWTYFAHVSDLWQLGQYLQLVAFPLFWLLFMGTGLWAASDALICIFSQVASHRQRGLDAQTFRRYGDRYLGVWSPNDEAINGIGSTPFLQGEIASKLRFEGVSAVARSLVVLAWPGCFLYNRLVADGTNEFIWERIARRLQGADVRGVELERVSYSPCLAFEGWPPLPSDLEMELVESANRNAASTLAAIRETLGFSVASDPDSPTVIPRIAAQLTFRELIHTSYCLSSSVQDLIALHILSHSGMRSGKDAEVAHSQFAAWYFHSRQRAANPVSPDAPPSQIGRADHRVLPVVQGIGLAGIALLAWTGLSGLYRSYVDVLTDEYQINVIRSAAPDIVPSLHWSESLCWLQALTALGQLPEVRRDLEEMQFQFASDKSQTLSTVAATLRALHRPQDAMTFESDALAKALAIPDDQQRTYGLGALAEELASFGIVPRVAISPTQLNFLRTDELQKVSDAAANGGYPEVAEQILVPPDGPPSPELRFSYDRGVKTILTALLKLGRKAEALDLASNEYNLMRQIGTQDPISDAVIVEAYVVNGRWDDAEQIADQMKSDKAFATIAGLRIDSGDLANATTDLAKVKTWQYATSNGAHIAAGLSRLGQADAAKQLALKTITDLQLYDNPWWNVQELIENQNDLRDAGAAAELQSAEWTLLRRTAKDSTDGDRPAESLIKIGDLQGAEVYCRSIPGLKTRAVLFARLSIAFSDANQPGRAQQELVSAVEAVSKLKGELAKSPAYAQIAQAQAHLHHFRLARLAAEKSVTSTDRLRAYADILDEFAIARSPGLKGMVADPRLTPSRRP